MSAIDVLANRSLSFTDSRICEFCETLLWRVNDWASNPAAFQKERNKQVHSAFRPKDLDIQAAACHFCALFLSLFDHDEQRELEEGELKVGSEWSSGTLRKLFIGKKTLSVNQDDPTSELHSLYDCEDLTNPEPSTWSIRTLKRAHQWLSKCVLGHEGCSKGISPGFLPSRLIDVGLDDEMVPRLLDKSMLKEPQRYVSLSHCWGGKVPLVLRRESLEAMRQGINYKDLPKTFQHALIVTRELECRYIWIDSLCIIQDSHDDWEKESSQMHQVYSNAFFNIAASAAENSTGGLFFKRNQGSIIPLRITINKRGYYIEPPHTGKYKMVDGAPLNRRGWVYQERFLSPRILHFTSSQLFLECKTSWACETFPVTYPVEEASRYFEQINSFNPGLDGLRIRQRDGGHILNSSEDPFLDAFAIWKEIVAKYSRCCLTQDTDRLVALSGIAAVANGFLDDECLAGIWRKHLPYNLTWLPFGENNRPAIYTAPSWSWASVTGGVQTKSLRNLPNECSVKIIQASVELAGLSKFGQVKGGFIRLKGSIMAIPLSICHSTEPKQPCMGCKEESETLSLKFALDVSRPGVGRFEESRQRLHFPLVLENGIQGGYHEKFDEHQMVFGVPILSNLFGDRREADGLLLEATGDKIDEFRRIGMFSYDALGNPPSQWLKALQSFDRLAVSLGFEPLPTNHPDYDFQYIITII